MSVVQRPHLTVLRGYTTTKATPSTFVRVRQRVHNRKLVCPQWARRAAQGGPDNDCDDAKQSTLTGILINVLDYT